MAKFGLPGISSKLPTDVRQFLERVREALTGSGADSIVTYGDLIRAGLAGSARNGDLTLPEGNNTLNLTPPPAPTTLTATGAMTNILVEWDTPLYGHHSHTEIWASGVDDIGQRVYVGRSEGSLYAHAVGTATTRYYWVRFVSIAGIEGPFNAVAGVLGETSQDPAFLLSVLTGQLSESQLIADLNTRIDLVDAADTTAGSVSARIKTSHDALQVQISALSATPAYDNTVDYALSDTVSYSGSLYQVSTETPGAGYLPTDTTYWTKIGDYDSLASAVGAHEAAIDAINYVSASSSSASAVALAAVQSTVGGHTASISTQATSIGGLEAQYTVKINSSGYVTGYGLASSPVDGTPYSEFAVVADKFSIAPVATSYSAADGSPFFHLTASTSIGGVSVPAGTYMKSAYIHDASITNAKIGSLAVDSAKIGTGAVVEAKIGTAAVTTAKIKDANITTAKIAAAQINTAHIIDGNITSAKIGTAAVTNAKIGTAAITEAKIGTAAVTSAKIGTAAVTNAKIADAAITNAKIGSLAVDTLNLADQAVTFPNYFSYGTTLLLPAGVWQDYFQTINVTCSGTGSVVLVLSAMCVAGGSSSSVYVEVQYSQNSGASWTTCLPSRLVLYEATEASGSSISASCKLNPAAGTIRYKLRVMGDSAGGSRIENSSIMTIEAKK